MLKRNVLPTVTVATICIAVALILSVVNIFAEPLIEKNRQEATRKALLEVYPEGKEFTSLELTDHSFSGSITEAYSSDNGGYVFKCSVKGYKKGLVIMVGISPDGRVTGTKCIESKETNGAEKKLSDTYVGRDVDGMLDVEVIGGSTKTSKAYHQAVKDSLEAFSSLRGVSPEELLLQKEQEAIASIYPSSEVTPIDISGHMLPEEIAKAYSVSEGGYVFLCRSSGYKPELTTVIGITSDGKIRGSVTIASNETNGAERELDGAYNGKSSANAEKIVINRSTKTSDGYYASISAAFGAFEVLTEGATA